MVKVFIATIEDSEIIEICNTLIQAKDACENNFDGCSKHEYFIYEAELVSSSIVSALSWENTESNKKKGKHND